MDGRVAVVLFNLGGPDQPEAVEPFLFNLFNDPAIVSVPGVVRRPLAKFISRRRSRVAREIYGQIGGRSPLLELTREQAQALEQRLSARGLEARVFVCMRYWHPMSDDVAAEVAGFDPARIVLLPLYPQFSTTTSQSSLNDWGKAARRRGLRARQHAVCCYPLEPGFVAAQTRLVEAALDQASEVGQPRVLFSAHGLPKRVVDRGDPYQWQVEQTVAEVVRRLGRDNLDHVVCYQSRVGPLEWIGPDTEEEIARAGRDGVPVVVVPIAFVSEHSETLVELDMTYATVAKSAGVPRYVRVPTVGTDAEFMDGLARLVEDAATRDGTCPADGRRLCPPALRQCPCGGSPASSRADQ